MSEIPIVVGVLGMVAEGLEKRLKKSEIKDRIKNIQTTLTIEV